MKYQVIWQKPAEQELAVIWLSAPDRAAVTAAAAFLDARLTSDPLAVGESRTSSIHRIAFRAPLGVEYEVVPDDRRVFVQGVFFAGGS